MHYRERAAIGEEIRYFHQLSGYTLRQLAERTRITVDTLRRIEAGAVPTAQHIAALVRELGIPADVLAELRDRVSMPRS